MRDRPDWTAPDAFAVLVGLLSAWCDPARAPRRSATGVPVEPLVANCVLMVGPPGVGRKRLVRSAVREIRAQFGSAVVDSHVLRDWSDFLDRQRVVAATPSPLDEASTTELQVVDVDFDDVFGCGVVSSDGAVSGDGAVSAESPRRIVVLEDVDDVFGMPADLMTAAAMHAGDDGGGGGDHGEGGDAATVRRLGSLIVPGGALAPLAGIDATTALVSLVARLSALPEGTFVIMTARDATAGGGGDAGSSTLHPLLRRCAALELRVDHPSGQVRTEYLSHRLTECLAGEFFGGAHAGVMPANAEAVVASLASELALRCGGATFAHLEALARDTVRDAQYIQQLRSAAMGHCDPAAAGLAVACQVARARPVPRDPAGEAAPLPVPDRVLWSDIVGLDHAKDVLQAAARRLTKSSSTSDTPDDSAPASHGCGVLLFGLPGTGKTMLAKAMATEAAAAFMTASVPELVHSAVGESERHVRALFQRARAAAPAVVFLDEVQAAFGTAANAGGGDAEVAHHARLVATLEEELDECRFGSGGNRVLVVAATNVPQHLGLGLLREGRIDVSVHVPPPPAEARAGMVAATLTKWGWTPPAAGSDDRSTRGGALRQLLPDALAARSGALWTAADVAAALNLVGLQVLNGLLVGAADADGGGADRPGAAVVSIADVARWWNHAACDADRAMLERTVAEAVAAVQPSGSALSLAGLTAWRHPTAQTQR